MQADAPPPGMLRALARMGLLAPGATATGAALTGGVSSDIWRVELPGGPVCVKRALAQLRVAADWRAPVERNRYEAAWMQVAADAVPGCVPALLGQDAAEGALAMQFMPPDSHALWKTVLRDGGADPGFATAVAAALVGIHAHSAARPALAAEFPTDKIFFEIRLAPYLLEAAARHPDRAEALRALVAATQAHKVALVHGDVSPKNILIGPRGPVFLDAECAWWGDPAFDLAFCLNHLLLKCLWTPHAAAGFLACFDALAERYLQGVTWEQRDALEARAARLLPGLLLARVDGKSPVEYITDDSARNRVRTVARARLAAPADRLDQVRRDWAQEIRR